GLQAAGIKDFLLIVGYHSETIREYFGDGTCFGLRIQYATQVVQDGTGRVVDLARDFVGDSPFVLSYGDILVDPVNYKSIVDLAQSGRKVKALELSGEWADVRDPEILAQLNRPA